MVSPHLEAERDRLLQLIQVIRDSGSVAQQLSMLQALIDRQATGSTELLLETILNEPSR